MNSGIGQLAHVALGGMVLFENPLLVQALALKSLLPLSPFTRLHEGRQAGREVQVRFGDSLFYSPV